MNASLNESWWRHMNEVNTLDELPHLLENLQEEVAIVEADRGTITEDVAQKALILAEEVFEVLKILRYRSGVATSTSVEITMLGEELADLLFVTAAVANRLNTHLAKEVSSCDEFSYQKVRMASRSRAKERETSLQFGLSIASEVLAVVTAVSYKENSCSANLVFFPSADIADKCIEQSLGRVALLVGQLADYDSINLKIALAKKLKKDQFRLWSAIDEGLPAASVSNRAD